MSQTAAFSFGKQMVRRGAIALAAVGALTTANPGVSLAQTQDDVVHSPACMKLHPRLAQLRCEITVSKKKIAAADARSAAAAARIAAADKAAADAAKQSTADQAETKCALFIKAGLTTADATKHIDKAAVQKILNGRSFRDVNACAIAARFGYTPS